MRRLAPLPIVASDIGWLLGGTYGQHWLDAPTTASLLHGGEQYRRVGASGALGAAAGDRPISLGSHCDRTFSVNLTPQATISNTVALGGSWNPLPRRPIEESLDTASYRQFVAEQLHANGIATPEVRLTRILRVDLEGDGTGELLIAATRLDGEGRFPPSSVAAGDYSLVMIRTAIDGVQRSIDVVAEYYPEVKEDATPNKHSLVAVADLNGDGRLEIVIDSAYYEGAAVVAYSVAAERAEMVLYTGCGS